MKMKKQTRRNFMKQLGWFAMASSMAVGGWYGLRRFQIANSPELRVNRYGGTQAGPKRYY